MTCTKPDAHLKYCTCGLPFYTIAQGTIRTLIAQLWLVAKNSKICDWLPKMQQSRILVYWKCTKEESGLTDHVLGEPKEVQNGG